MPKKEELQSALGQERGLELLGSWVVGQAKAGGPRAKLDQPVLTFQSWKWDRRPCAILGLVSYLATARESLPWGVCSRQEAGPTAKGLWIGLRVTY